MVVVGLVAPGVITAGDADVVGVDGWVAVVTEGAVVFEVDG